MNYWFTADCHFGHTNILKYANRPFSTTFGMDAEIIHRWNSRVGIDDTVYHLGDFCFLNKVYYLSQLRGNIVLLAGSHDVRGGSPDIKIIKPLGLLDEYGNQRTIVLCHYSMRSWPLSHYASWHLFGHHHGKLEPYGLSFDVGVDAHDFYPWSLAEIEEKMATLKPIVDFRKA
jgi:calcineurin-like phosphoesterase family protein